ncbi:hypothetical protein UY3_03693 [Chelonia mydas]|uniref:Uncharacterized protein n=1 Tax=Chelonia mydas TaxID=8469 RepID=M7BPD6_CHEMY|nr:hypothetical protein UY3_03693 [Chelonia mydas]
MESVLSSMFEEIEALDLTLVAQGEDDLLPANLDLGDLTPPLFSPFSLPLTAASAPTSEEPLDSSIDPAIDGTLLMTTEPAQMMRLEAEDKREVKSLELEAEERRQVKRLEAEREVKCLEAEMQVKRLEVELELKCLELKRAKLGPPGSSPGREEARALNMKHPGEDFQKHKWQVWPIVAPTGRGLPLQANGGCGKWRRPRDVLATLLAAPIGLEWRTEVSGSCDWPNLWMRQHGAAVCGSDGRKILHVNNLQVELLIINEDSSEGKNKEHLQARTFNENVIKEFSLKTTK